LHWPQDWPRTAKDHRKQARFNKKDTSGKWAVSKKLTVYDAAQRVICELAKMGVDDDYVISTNLQTRLDGLPKSNQGEPADPGAAVYWKEGDNLPLCMAIDIYDSVIGNLAAIAATLEALRSIERHGGGQVLNRAFAGFAALPHLQVQHWWEILGIDKGATAEEIKRAYQNLASQHHPDKGGNAADMSRINKAFKSACEEYFLSKRCKNS